MLVPVKEYTSVAELRADIAERRARLKALGYAWQDPPKQVAPPPPVPAPALPPPPPPPCFEPKYGGCPPSLRADVPTASAPPPRMTMSIIIVQVARFYGLPPGALCSRAQTQDIVFARHVSIYLIRALMGYSFPEIGRRFGRDHTTALHGAVRIATLARDRWELAHDLWDITEAIEAALSGPPSVHAGEDGEVLYGEHRGPPAKTSLTATTPRRAAHLGRAP